jgi:two-component system response regulator
LGRRQDKRGGYILLHLTKNIIMMEKDIETLIVEDNETDAEMTIRALKKNNITNHFHVTNGAEALDFIFARGQYTGRDITRGPKVVVLDLKMPKVTGFEVIEQLKADERTRNIPIVVLTASDQEIDKETCYKLGISSYVVKPTELEHFYKAIASVAFYWMVTNLTKR